MEWIRMSSGKELVLAATRQSSGRREVAAVLQQRRPVVRPPNPHAWKTRAATDPHTHSDLHLASDSRGVKLWPFRRHLHSRWETVEQVDLYTHRVAARARSKRGLKKRLSQYQAADTGESLGKIPLAPRYRCPRYGPLVTWRPSSPCTP